MYVQVAFLHLLNHVETGEKNPSENSHISEACEAFWKNKMSTSYEDVLKCRSLRHMEWNKIDTKKVQSVEKSVYISCNVSIMHMFGEMYKTVHR